MLVMVRGFWLGKFNLDLSLVDEQMLSVIIINLVDDDHDDGTGKGADGRRVEQVNAGDRRSADQVKQGEAEVCTIQSQKEHGSKLFLAMELKHYDDAVDSKGNAAKAIEHVKSL